MSSEKRSINLYFFREGKVKCSFKKFPLSKHFLGIFLIFLSVKTSGCYLLLCSKKYYLVLTFMIKGFMEILSESING